jgi:hypothetical protein
MTTQQHTARSAHPGATAVLSQHAAAQVAAVARMLQTIGDSGELVDHAVASTLGTRLLDLSEALAALVYDEEFDDVDETLDQIDSASRGIHGRPLDQVVLRGNAIELCEPTLEAMSNRRSARAAQRD